MPVNESDALLNRMNKTHFEAFTTNKQFFITWNQTGKSEEQLTKKAVNVTNSYHLYKRKEPSR